MARRPAGPCRSRKRDPSVECRSHAITFALLWESVDHGRWPRIRRAETSPLGRRRADGSRRERPRPAGSKRERFEGAPAALPVHAWDSCAHARRDPFARRRRAGADQQDHAGTKPIPSRNTQQRPRQVRAWLAASVAASAQRHSVASASVMARAGPGPTRSDRDESPIFAERRAASFEGADGRAREHGHGHDEPCAARDDCLPLRSAIARGRYARDAISSREWGTIRPQQPSTIRRPSGR